MSKKSNGKFKTSIGGQALIEGVMMRGPEKTAVAVRTPDGTISNEYMEYSYIKDKSKFFKLPLVRGVVGMIDSMKMGFKCLMYSAEKSGMDLEEEEEGKVAKWLTKVFGKSLFDIVMWIGMALGVVLSLLLFTYLPSLVFNLLANHVFTVENSQWFHGNENVYSLIRAVFIGIIKIVIFIFYVVLCSRQSDVRRVFMYHGAEHKTIFCYEAQEELTVENVRKQSRFHPRCGTSFLILMLIIGIIIGMFIRFDSALLQAAARVLLLPLTMGLGYELIRLCGKYDNWLVRIISAPGMWMQRLTTKEPDDSMIEVAIDSIKAVIPENGEDHI